MALPVLPAGMAVNCPHGAAATVVPSQPRVLVGGQPVLVQSDQGIVAGCPFTLPNGTPSPCVTVRWVSASVRVKANGVPILLQSSSTLCLAATQAPQGPAIVPSGSPRVLAT